MYCYIYILRPLFLWLMSSCQYVAKLIQNKCYFRFCAFFKPDCSLSTPRHRCQRVNSRQSWCGSSSVPSPQSLASLHTFLWPMQRPFPHWNWSGAHGGLSAGRCSTMICPARQQRSVIPEEKKKCDEVRQRALHLIPEICCNIPIWLFHRESF